MVVHAFMHGSSRRARDSRSGHSVRRTDRLAFSARLLARPSPTSQSDVARTCDSTATQLRLDTPHLRLTSHLRLTCDSLSPALSKVVISASATSQGTDYRLHPKAIVTAYKFKAYNTTAYKSNTNKSKTLPTPIGTDCLLQAQGH